MSTVILVDESQIPVVPAQKSPNITGGKIPGGQIFDSIDRLLRGSADAGNKTGLTFDENFWTKNKNDALQKIVGLSYFLTLKKSGWIN